jgi:purine-nucleoside phosphorylase
VLDEQINHEEVMETGKRVEKQFTELLVSLVPQIAVEDALETPAQ